MKHIYTLSILIVCCYKYGVSLGLPGPLVYVVTPAPKTTGEGARSAPFYYHNWMRRMDPPLINATTTTTTEKSKTPDLIFAEFESGNKMKSIRNLLEKERVEKEIIEVKTSTTASPIYVADDDMKFIPQLDPPKKVEYEQTTEPDRTDYFAFYNNLYNGDNAPVYLPKTTSTTTTTSTTAAPVAPNVENIWHIIDSEKHDQYSGRWEEEPIGAETEKDATSAKPHEDKKTDDENIYDNNFVFPGFSTNPGNGAENESRAIRTEPNIRFPYVNLKPFQMKTQMKSVMNGISNSKKGNMYTSLDNFHDIKNPVRGEAEDVGPMPTRQPIDRYNPAQPYLPQPTYGSKSKQSSPVGPPVRTVANLVPPPPPPPPRITDNDFPSPTNYESFPPYAPVGPPTRPPLPSSAQKPSIAYQPPATTDDTGPDGDSDGDSDGPPMDIGYRYKPPSPQVQPFVPTIPPLTKPFTGYSYNKPLMADDSPSLDSMDDNPAFYGYHYKKPEAPASPPAHDSPPDSMDEKPVFYGYHYKKPQAPAAPSASDSPPDDSMADKPVFHGYQYKKPESPPPTADLPSPSYGHHSYQPDYPELIFDKHHGMKDDDMKDNDMGMVPPPPPADMDMKPDMDHGLPDDSGFPHDFPGDFKYHHDFDDDHHYHHHHPTTTTTTTEMPRVNRYSYYYLGKKLYYLPLYFSVYFIVYVGALIIKAVLRHKIVYPNSWRPNDMTASFFSKRSIDSSDNEKLHEITEKVTHAIAVAGEKYFDKKKTK